MEFVYCKVKIYRGNQKAWDNKDDFVDVKHFPLSCERKEKITPPPPNELHVRNKGIR